MKKRNLLLLIIIMLLITGCSKRQKLVCEKKEKTTGMTIESKLVNRYIDDKINKVEQNTKVTLDDSYLQYKDQIKQSLDQKYRKYKSDEGFDYQLTTKNNIIYLKMNVDATKTKKATAKGLEFDAKETYKTSKKNLESNGYTCK